MGEKSQGRGDGGPAGEHEASSGSESGWLWIRGQCPHSN
jgi:hypothetical protein